MKKTALTLLALLCSTGALANTIEAEFQYRGAVFCSITGSSDVGTIGKKNGSNFFDGATPYRFTTVSNNGGTLSINTNTDLVISAPADPYYESVAGGMWNVSLNGESKTLTEGLNEFNISHDGAHELMMGMATSVPPQVVDVISEWTYTCN
ncbi:hypothetical protein [Vibrio harveyi]|uniref:hypothetical protein n=1 Tax=Vibrio harveyi TaxID=669 RepID=UPI0018F13D60|nr:hypothetical protein [Vibrio harveyi]